MFSRLSRWVDNAVISHQLMCSKIKDAFLESEMPLAFSNAA